MKINPFPQASDALLQEHRDHFERLSSMYDMYTNMSKWSMYQDHFLTQANGMALQARLLLKKYDPKYVEDTDDQDASSRDD